MNPFKHFRLVRTTLQLTAFALSCWTVILLYMVKSGSIEWNLKVVGVVFLNILGIFTVAQVQIVKPEDRSKLLFRTVVFLGTCTTIIVLSIDILRAPQTSIFAQPRLPRPPQFTDPKAASNEPMRLNAVASAAVSGDYGKTNANDIEYVDIDPANVTQSETPEEGHKNSVASEQNSRLWVKPIFIKMTNSSFGWNEMDTAPPLEIPEGEKWAAKYRFDDHLESPEWYLDGPWQIWVGGLVYETNSIATVPIGHTVGSGFIYSIKRKDFFRVSVWRPQVAGGGGAHSTLEELKERSIPRGPRIDSTVEHSLKSYLQVFQDTQSPKPPSK